MLHTDRSRAESFGEDAERYDRARPRYPVALVDELLACSPTTVLDVGCGTGIVASLFSERGCRVLGVEPDERMARVARRKGIEVEVATFERWRAGARRFDLLVCGQAWHWIDPLLGVEKAAHALRDGGRLAVFWNFGVPPPTIRPALDAAYRRLAPGLERYAVLLGNRDARLQTVTEALVGNDRFTAPRARMWSWSRRYSTEQWLEHLLTHSDHKTLDPGQRAALLAAVREAIDEHGGTLEIAYETHLVSAYRR